MEQINSFIDLKAKIEAGKTSQILEHHVCPSCDLIAPAYWHADWGAATLCKCDEKRRASASALYEYAGLPEGQHKVFGTFYVPPGSSEALHAATAFAKGEGPPILVLSGTPGSGKTHLLEAVGRYLIEENIRVKFANVPELMHKIRSAYEQREFAEGLIAQYYKAPVLLLDELGAERGTDTAKEVVISLVNHRYANERRLMVTTNLTFEHMRNRDERLASRLFDTETGNVKNVICSGDFRSGNK